MGSAPEIKEHLRQARAGKLVLDGETGELTRVAPKSSQREESDETPERRAPVDFTPVKSAFQTFD